MVDWRDLSHCLFFQETSLVLLIRNGSSASSYSLYFSYFMNLGEATAVLESCFYVGVFLCSVCESNVFGCMGCF